MTDNPAARQMLGYLFTRGGVHARAYAMALEKLTGVEMKPRCCPSPTSRIRSCPSRSPSRRMAGTAGSIASRTRTTPASRQIWNGQHPDGSGELVIVDGPPDGGKMNDYEGISEAFVPEYSKEEFFEIANKLYKKM